MRTSIVALALLSLTATAPSWADVVELKTGQRIEGTFRQAGPSGVVIEVGGQTITFDQDKVRAIYFGSAPTQAQSQPSALTETLKALKALQSVTRGGIAYRDYAPRVNDAKIVVDRYLQEPPEQGSGEVRSAIADAMDYHVLAASAWNARVTRGDYTRAGTDPAIEKCPEAKRILDQELQKRGPRPGDPLPLSYYVGSTLAYFGLPALWSCASDRIAEAERALKATPTETQK